MSARPAQHTKRPRLVPVEVLADCYNSRVRPTSVFVAPITDKKFTSILVSQLSKEFPLQELQHLKRVRNTDHGLEIILCAREDDLPAVSGLEGIDRSRIRKHEVALNAPLTRSQFAESSLLWPTQFHENKEIERSLEGTFFNAMELGKIEGFMRTAIQSLNRSCIETDQADANVALVVNPATDSVIAIGSSCVGDNPVLHATMVGLDLVARLQGGGAWMTGLPLQEVTEDDQVPPGGSAPYICTGYDVYMLREPCAMCAMALVHSRIRRAFYGAPDPKRGSLGSRFKIHCLGGLNHSFRVWKNIIPDECQRALQRVPPSSP